MQKEQTGRTKQSRGGDTGRTSSQGRKLASGGIRNNKKGSPDINEDTKNPVKEENKKRRIPGSKGIST